MKNLFNYWHANWLRKVPFMTMLAITARMCVVLASPPFVKADALCPSAVHIAQPNE